MTQTYYAGILVNRKGGDEVRKKVNLSGYECKCERCGHEWVSMRKEPVKVCPSPKCHNAWWNMPRKEKGEKVNADTN